MTAVNTSFYRNTQSQRPLLFHHRSCRTKQAVLECGGKNLGPVIRILGSPGQLEDSRNVSPVITSIASVGDEFRRRQQQRSSRVPDILPIGMDLFDSDRQTLVASLPFFSIILRHRANLSTSKRGEPKVVSGMSRAKKLMHSFVEYLKCVV